MFGNSWIIDEKPFRPAFTSWREFKNSYERFSLDSMTVNERLFALNLLDDFDAAVISGDRARIKALLQRTYVDEKLIDAIIHKAQSGKQA